MKVQQYEGTQERNALISMITSTEMVAAITPAWEADEDCGLFSSVYANLIGNWCVNHFKQHGRCIGKYVKDRYSDWEADSTRDPDVNKFVNKILLVLSDESEQKKDFQLSVELANAEKMFRRVQLERHAELIEGLKKQNKIDEAVEKMKAFVPITLGVAEEMDVIASSIVPERVDWLWKGWMALGEITMWDGMQGEGKSQMELDIAARVTRAWKMPPFMMEPDPDRVPGNVIIVANEDSWKHAIVPRLMAAGADLNKIINPKKDGDIRLPQDLGLLRSIILKHNAVMVIFDPILGTIGDKTNANSDPEVRRFLAPVTRMIRETKVCCNFVRHFKKELAEARHRGMGSVAWSAVCRLGAVIGKSQKHGDKVQVACSKSNLAAFPKSLEFYVEPATVSPPDPTRPGKRMTIDTSKIFWVGESECSANDIAGQQQEKKTLTKECENVIRELLETGPMPSGQLIKEVTLRTKASQRTIEIARKELRVERYKEKGKHAIWMVRLPG